MACQGSSDRESTDAKNPPRLADPDLRIASTTFDDETARRLIDEWVVPALVEEFLQCHNRLPRLDNSKVDQGDQS